ncbi:MAG: hypothetical protein COB15_13595 [Flavobacteriales bacterium]|nr:MAG: hypothetical protein COB15_13595 [Flavobacteriales bacterium]
MGFNISGLAINKNYENNFEDLQKELGWNLERQSEINFETASSNWKDEGICDVYFSDQGTLIFINMDMCTDTYGVKSDNILTFTLSETSTAYIIVYTENNIEKRSIMEVNGDRMTNKGERLEVEDKSEDAPDIIWNQVEFLLGKPFLDIDPNEKAVRYIFTKKNIEEENNSTANIKDTIPTEISSNKDHYNKSDKKNKEDTITSYRLDKPIFKEDLSNKFTDRELFKYFDKIITFAQQKGLNVFLNPSVHTSDSRRFLNLFNIVTEISNRGNLKDEIIKRMPLERFKLLCRIDPKSLDQKTKTLMMNELVMINSREYKLGLIKSASNKKRWEFWK